MLRAILLVALTTDPAPRLRGQQHLEAPPPATSLRSEVSAVSASSTLPDWKHYTFGAKNLIDGDTTTSWQPKGNPSGGVGEWVKLELKRDCTLQALEVANGLQMYDGLGNLFDKNNRINQAKLTFSDGSEKLIEFDAHDFGYVRFDLSGIRARWVRLEVETVHRGSKWNDLAISEVMLYGHCDDR